MGTGWSSPTASETVTTTQRQWQVCRQRPLLPASSSGNRHLSGWSSAPRLIKPPTNSFRPMADRISSEQSSAQQLTAISNEQFRVSTTSDPGPQCRYYQPSVSDQQCRYKSLYNVKPLPTASVIPVDPLSNTLDHSDLNSRPLGSQLHVCFVRTSKLNLSNTSTRLVPIQRASRIHSLNSLSNSNTLAMRRAVYHVRAATRRAAGLRCRRRQLSHLRHVISNIYVYTPHTTWSTEKIQPARYILHGGSNN